MMKTTALTLFLLILVSCTGKKGNVERRTPAEDSAIATLNRFAEISNPEVRINYLDDSSAFFWIPAGGTACISRDSFTSLLKSSSESFRWASLEVKALDSSYISYSGKYELKDRPGKNYLEEGILIRRNQRWKLLSGHVSASDN